MLHKINELNIESSGKSNLLKAHSESLETNSESINLLTQENKSLCKNDGSMNESKNLSTKGNKNLSMNESINLSSKGNKNLSNDKLDSRMRGDIRFFGVEG